MNNTDIANTRHSLSCCHMSVQYFCACRQCAWVMGDVLADVADVAYTDYKFKMYFKSCRGTCFYSGKKKELSFPALWKKKIRSSASFFNLACVSEVIAAHIIFFKWNTRLLNWSPLFWPVWHTITEFRNKGQKSDAFNNSKRVSPKSVQHCWKL